MVARFKKFITEAEKKGTVNPKNNFIIPEDLDVPVFLMCPPFSLETTIQNNVWMQELPPEKRKVDKNKAFEQWFKVYNFLTNLAMVYILPVKKGLQDLPFVANLGIKLPHLKNNTVVLSNFRVDGRKEEPAVGLDFFDTLGYNIVQAPEFFEGEADLIYLTKNFYAGAYNMRTSKNTLQWFDKQFDMHTIPIKMDNPHLYHLDCLLCPLTEKVVMTNVQEIDKPTLKEIEKHIEVHPVEPKLVKAGITSCIRIKNIVIGCSTINDLKPSDDDYVIEKLKIATLEKICSDYGLEPVIFNLSEFTKSGALVTCLVMHLTWPQYEGLNY